MSHSRKHSSQSTLNRRHFLLSGAVAAAGVAAGNGSKASAAPALKASPFKFCLNTSTIREQKLTIEQEIDLAAKAGYQAIEPWLNKLTAYQGGGGSLKDLRKRLDDQGVKVESAIGFATWIVDDEGVRNLGFEQAKKDMDLLAQIGAVRIAAPPSGVKPGQTIDLQRAAERYRKLLELGDQTGVVPELEFWGPSTAIGRLSTALYIAMEAAHPKACVLGDFYHMYKGGTSVDSLRLIGPATMPVVHCNDYPASPGRDKISDADRVYPGDGVAPLVDMLRILRGNGAETVLSLELFNREYWKQDAEVVVRTGMARMRRLVEAAMA